MAKVCPSCRQGRKDKWRRDKEDTKNFKIPEKAQAAPRKKDEAMEEAIKRIVDKTQGEPTPNSGKTQ